MNHTTKSEAIMINNQTPRNKIQTITNHQVKSKKATKGEEGGKACLCLSARGMITPMEVTPKGLS